MCPCCRRDFIVDPLDLLEEENNDSRNTTNNANENTSADQTPRVFSWDPATLENDTEFGPIIVTTPGNGAGNVAFDPTRLEEGLNPPAVNDTDTSNENSNIVEGEEGGEEESSHEQQQQQSPEGNENTDEESGNTNNATSVTNDDAGISAQQEV